MFKAFLIVASTLLPTSCGGWDNRFCYTQGENCDAQGETGPEGNPGSPGIQGTQGPMGSPGLPGRTGPRGANGASGAAGATGSIGPQGVSGINGDDGSSCTVQSTLAGAVVSCSDGSVAELFHGVDGEEGEAAPFAISQVIDPCGDGPGADEVILVFATGEWIAWYSGLGLSILTPGQTYQTTDQQACVFTVPN